MPAAEVLAPFAEVGKPYQTGGLELRKKMIQTQNPHVKSQVIQRLARIEGQLRGVQKMIAEERDCKDIVQQLIAIRSAIQSASLRFMQEVASECLLSPEGQTDPETQRANIADLITLLGKLSQ